MSLSVQIEKKLGDFRLEASFEAGEERLAMLGASGCGKSVTLRCIAGILKPDRGRIVLDGRVLFDSEQGIDLRPQERRVGYLFQQYALFPNMTVRQNIEAAVMTQGRRPGKAERRNAAERLLREFRIGEIAELRPGQISGGQKQRAALARILASEPALICLDEPFSALDSFLRRQLELGLSEMLSGFHGTLLWVSHDRGEVYRNCDRVCVMDRGKTLETGPVKEIFTFPQTEAAARLAGCRNFADAVPVQEAESAENAAAGTEGRKLVRVPDWNLTLQCSEPFPEAFRKAGIRSRSIRPAERDSDPNRFLCRVVSEIEEPECMSILLCPQGAEGCVSEDAAKDSGGSAKSPGEEGLLCMEISKDAWEAAKQQYAGTLPQLRVSVPEEEILLLR